jgi:hypothetical protein
MSDVLIGSFPKSETAEIRVMRNKYKGRKVLDIRLWYIPKGGVEMVPSQKGITFDLEKSKELAELLNRV